VTGLFAARDPFTEDLRQPAYRVQNGRHKQQEQQAMEERGAAEKQDDTSHTAEPVGTTTVNGPMLDGRHRDEARDHEPAPTVDDTTEQRQDHARYYENAEECEDEHDGEGDEAPVIAEAGESDDGEGEADADGGGEVEQHADPYADADGEGDHAASGGGGGEEEEEDHYDLEKCESLKKEGNDWYKDGQFEEAIDIYTEALYLCPPDQAKLKAIIFANRAACHMQLEKYDLVAADCSDAIASDTTYVKAFMRRCSAYEKLERWHDALTDMQKVVELDPSQRSRLAGPLARLETRAKEQFEKDKEEVVGKLKDLGNFFLGKIGLSLDNFKMEQNPETGGYNISFQQNTGQPSASSGSSSGANEGQCN